MKILIGFMLMALIIVSCGKAEDNVIAQVNNEKLYEADALSYIGEENWKNMEQSAKDEFIQDWIRLTLLAQEADKYDLMNEKEIKTRISNAEKNIKANALIAQKLANVEVSEDDLFNYYKLHKSQFITTHPEYKVQRIFCTDRNTLAEIRKEIQTSSFADAAKKYSEENAGNNGGYIGWISQNETENIFWNALKELKKYHYKTVNYNNGYYIIRYYDQRDVKKEKKFTEVIDEIREKVIEEKKNEIFKNLIDDLKKQAQISISA